MPPLPPCGTGDTTAPGPAALFLPAARTGGLFMIDMGQGEAAQAARTATSGGACSAVHSGSGQRRAGGHVRLQPLRGYSV